MAGAESMLLAPKLGHNNTLSLDRDEELDEEVEVEVELELEIDPSM